MDLRDLKVKLVLVSFFILFLGFFLQTIVGLKIQYPLVLVLLILIILFSLLDGILSFYSLYFLFLIPSCIYNWYNKSSYINESFYFSLFTYIVIPLSFSGKKIFFTELDYRYFFRIVEFFVYFNFMGLCFQFYGIESDFLKIEGVMNGDVYHQRYTGFSGGSLAFGLLNCFCSINCIIKIYNNKNSIFNFLTLIISITGIYFSYSRRFYILLLVILVFMHFTFSKKRISIKYILYILFFTQVVLIILYFAGEMENLSNRLIMMFDFENDGSNVLRLIKWIDTFNAFSDNLLFGIGQGSTSTVGVNIEGVSSSELFVSESYFLKMFAENGLAFGLVYVFLCVKILNKFYKYRRLKDFTVPYFYLFFFIVESLSSTSLESPLGSILFWSSVSTLLNFKN